jgi:hypothetical protein
MDTLGAFLNAFNSDKQPSSLRVQGSRAAFFAASGQLFKSDDHRRAMDETAKEMFA